jgi:hypothetical protein
VIVQGHGFVRTSKILKGSQEKAALHAIDLQPLTKELVVYQCGWGAASASKTREVSLRCVGVEHIIPPMATTLGGGMGGVWGEERRRDAGAARAEDFRGLCCLTRWDKLGSEGAHFSDDTDIDWVRGYGRLSWWSRTTHGFCDFTSKLCSEPQLPACFESYLQLRYSFKNGASQCLDGQYLSLEA